MGDPVKGGGRAGKYTREKGILSYFEVTNSLSSLQFNSYSSCSPRNCKSVRKLMHYLWYKLV